MVGADRAVPFDALLLLFERLRGLMMIGDNGRSAVCAALVSLMSASSTQAAVYYVAPNGSPTNNGSAGAPWRQIRTALPFLAPGDTVLVADGSYLGFTMEEIDGAPGLPITIKAVGQNAVVATTTDRPDNRDTIKITFCSHVVIDGLRAFNANRAAVRVDTSPNITITNGVFGNNATWGIFTNHSDNLLIERNTCYGSAAEHGIYVSNACVNPIVRGNTSYGNRACGLHFNGDLSAGGNGLILGALVEKNVIFNNGAGGGAGINMDGVRNATIRNNLLYNNTATGIALFQIDGALGPSGIDVYFNTIDQASTGRWALHISQSDLGVGKIRVRNNILKHRNTGRGGIEYYEASDVANTDSDYNVVDRITPNDGTNIYSLAQWKAQGYEPHSISATNAALFVNADAGNYVLLANAPAIAAGQPISSVTTDIRGVWRQPTGPADIGCYQHIRAIPGPRSGGKPGR
jgi:hypothetical protein